MNVVPLPLAVRLCLLLLVCLPVQAQVTNGSRRSGTIMQVYYVMRPEDTLPEIAARFYRDFAAVGNVMFQSRFYPGTVIASEARVCVTERGVEVTSKNATVYGSARNQMTRTTKMIEVFDH